VRRAWNAFRTTGQFCILVKSIFVLGYFGSNTIALSMFCQCIISKYCISFFLEVNQLLFFLTAFSVLLSDSNDSCLSDWGQFSSLSYPFLCVVAQGLGLKKSSMLHRSGSSVLVRVDTTITYSSLFKRKSCRQQHNKVSC